MKKIKLKMSVMSALITAVVLVCVLVVNGLISVVTEKHPLKIDLTKDKVYEFSQRTKEVMKNLDTEIKAYALIPEGTDSEYVDYIKQYLGKYKALSSKFKVEYVDPYSNPTFMTKYNDGETQASAGSVILTMGDDFKIVPFDQIYNQNSYTGSVEIDMERKVTNAIMKLTGQLSGVKAYFLSGHGEYEGTNLKSLLEDEGYTTGSVNLSVEAIPDDASVLFSLAPQSDWTAEERDAIDKFMDKGGKLVLAANPGMKPAERLDGYLAEWGLKLDYDYVIEGDDSKALSAGNGLPVPAPQLSDHAINKKIAESDSVFVSPASMSVSKIKSANSATVSELLTTSDKSYGKVNLESNSIEKEDGDIDGPLSVASISEKTGDKTSSVVVIGSLSALESNGILSEGAYLNGDFVLNTVNYLCGSNEDLGIRAKQVSAEQMTMTEQQIAVCMLVLQIIVPIVIILIGLFVWLKRRNK